MDQHDLYIPVDKLTKGTQDDFFDVYDVILTCYLRSFKVICPLGCRNIGKLLNGQNAHFRFKPHGKYKSMNTKAYFYLY